jgi:alpha-beta hydrolase superfamily lysophospholipase
MSSRSWRVLVLGSAGLLVVLWLLVLTQLPSIGANALLHPLRRQVAIAAPVGCRTRTVDAGEVTLTGWSCDGRSPQRATVVYLHGVADNRASAVGLIHRFVPHGLNVVAFDSRAHGDSSGDTCTYGFFEQDDLRRILDTVARGPIVLVGNSLGAAVALQEAAHDPRVTAIVAIAPFSDLRTIATERAPFVFTHGAIERAFALAETNAHFQVDAVSPVAAARAIAVPTLLVHGAADVDTPPSHSARILAALAGPKRLILVPGLHHNDALPDSVWDGIDRWIAKAIGSEGFSAQSG